MVAVYKRELHSLFKNMLVWVYFAIFVTFTGIFSSIYNFYGRISEFESVLNYLILIVIIAVPIMTMRSISDERKNKTDILLMSLPIKTSDFVMGKYLALITVNLLSCLFLCVVPIILSLYAGANFNPASAYASILAFFLCTSTFYAIGIFMSSLTDNAVVAALLSFGTLILIYFMRAIVSLLPTALLPSLIFMSALALAIGLIAYITCKSIPVSTVFFLIPEILVLILLIFNKELLISLPIKLCAALSLTDRLSTMIGSGIISISSMVYFITVALLFVFFAIVSSERRKYE